MRLYVPATLAQIHDRAGLRPAAAHAVTPALAAALPGEDREGLELAALLAAADESVALLALHLEAPRRRVVVAAEVVGVGTPPIHGAEALPSAVTPPETIGWDQVVSLHVDEPDAEPDVTAAAEGGSAALDRSAERDLLWYDVTELEYLRATYPRRPVA